MEIKSTTHKIKLQECFCNAVLDGRKTFEIRYNDRGYQTGDYIQFSAVDKHGTPVAHDINNNTYIITYTLAGWGLPENYVVFSIKEVDF